MKIINPFKELFVMSFRAEFENSSAEKVELLEIKVKVK